MEASKEAIKLVEEFKRYAMYEDCTSGTMEGEHQAIQCAIICVDRILSINPHEVIYVEDKFDPLRYTKEFKNTYGYWQEVKQCLNYML